MPRSARRSTATGGSSRPDATRKRRAERRLRRAGRGTSRPRCRRRPGTPRAAAARTSACGRARSATPCPASGSRPRMPGRRQHDSSGQRETARFCVSRPRNHRASSNGTPDGDRELAGGGRSGLGRAPERAARGVGVLVVLGGAVLLLERRPREEPAAHDLPLDRARHIHRDGEVVVLVHARDRPRAVDAQEVQRDAGVHRQQVRHPHAGRLVRHAERVAEVLDREVAVLLRLLEERHRRRLGHEAARGVVVDLEPLLRGSRRSRSAPCGRAAGAPSPAAPSSAGRGRRGSRRAAGRCGRSPGRSPSALSAAGR